MEFLLVFLLLAVFLGPTAYHMYERYKRFRQGRGWTEEKKGPSYFHRLLRMLGPVFLLIVLLTLLGVGLYLLAGPQTVADAGLVPPAGLRFYLK